MPGAQERGERVRVSGVLLRRGRRWGGSELTRGHATILLARLGACAGIPAAGGVPAVLHGPLRDLVQAARDLAGPAWLAGRRR
jgi:hypothetical protein